MVCHPCWIRYANDNHVGRVSRIYRAERFRQVHSDFQMMLLLFRTARRHDAAD